MGQGLPIECDGATDRSQRRDVRTAGHHVEEVETDPDDNDDPAGDRQYPPHGGLPDLCHVDPGKRFGRFFVDDCSTGRFALSQKLAGSVGGVVDVNLLRTGGRAV